MSAARESLALPAGAVIGPYRVRQVQSAWGFYLVYAGVDPRTGEVVLIQELVPEEWCVRGADGVLAGRDAAAQEKLAGACGRYLAEGRALAALTVPGVRKIREVVEANGTACWITPPDEARTCKSWLGELGRAPTEAELRRLLDALLAALAPVHAAGLGHFNLKPGTIQLTPGGRPVLAHFANARQAIARRLHDAGAATDGYSPPEQYDPDRSEDARTDVYALAAVCYRAIAGQPPPAAPQRIAGDTLGRLAERFAGRYSRRLLVALDAALALDPAARPRTLAAWRLMLGPSAAQQRTRVAVVAAVVALAVGLWFAFKPDPKPNDTQVKDSTSEEKAQEQTSEEKKTEEQKQADEQKMAEEKKQAGQEQKEMEEKLAEEKKKAEEAQKAAEEKRLAAEKAEEERRAKEEAMKQAKTAEEKAVAEAALKKAAEEAEAKKLAAEMAARKAAEEKKAADEAAAKAAAEMAARKAAEEKKAVDEAAAKVAAEMAARKVAEEKKAADEAAAKAAAEMVVRKAAEEKKAADEAVAKAAAEMAARKVAEERKAADEAAAKAAAEMAARKAAEEKKAAEQAAAKKRAEEMAAQARATPAPTPPPALSSGFFSSLPINGEWTPVDSTSGPARKLVIQAQIYTLSGTGATTGVAKLNGAVIYVTPKSTGQIEQGVCKMRALDRIVIEGTSLAGEWRRILKPAATPPP